MDSADDILRVLLVDDDEVDRAITRRALSSTKAPVALVECATAKDALKRLDEGPFACVLLDHLLPDATALELLPNLRRRHSALPVIVLTGHGDQQLAVDLMKAGASDYLSKDRLDGRLLSRAIEHAVLLGKAQQELDEAQRAHRVYLTRLRSLVSIAPQLYSERGVEGRIHTAVSATHALFSAEETFIGVHMGEDDLLRVTRGEQVTPLPADESSWRGLFEEARHAGVTAKTEGPTREGGLYVVPLLTSAQKWMGVLGLRIAPLPPAFSEMIEPLYAQLGEMISVAIENALLYEETQRAIGARDAVMAVVSHDLRSPLNSFNLSLELLRETHPSGPDRGILDRMQRAVVHMNRLIEDLLDVSRIERGELSISPSTVPVAVVFEELVSVCTPIAEASKIKLHLDREADIVVHADRHRVLQVLFNLVNNAIKFSPKGSTVTISATVVDADVVFSVTDQGPGIPVADRQRIFERFYRHGGNGLGLGLHISKAIVDAHDGRIWVENQPDVGARFYFQLRSRPSAAASARG